LKGKRKDAGFGILSVQNQPTTFNTAYFYEEEQEPFGIGNESTTQEEGKPGRGLCSVLWP